MKNIIKVATDFLEAEKSKKDKSVPVVVLSKKHTLFDAVSSFAHKNDIGMVALTATSIQDYFEVNEKGELVTDKFADLVRESKVVPFVLVIDHIQLVNTKNAAVLSAIAYAVNTNCVSWLYPGSSVVFIDYMADKPRPFFLADAKITVLEL